jgi:hypothetical protein
MSAVVPWVRIVFVGSTGSEVADWVIEGPDRPDLAVVEAVARLQLLARRCGGCIELKELNADLAMLLEFVGLAGEVGREPEGGEDVLGVEERMEPGDPVS